MSLATRCPACGTLFDIADGQLKAAGGRVRCGRCGEVFDATRSLVDAPSQAADASAGLPGFLHNAEPQAQRRRRRARAAWTCIALVLLAALALQAALHFQAEVAARWPAARDLLADACSATPGCRIEAPRVIDALSIEDSALAPLPGSDAYRLSLLLRNRAAFAIALPAVDLTLTDGEGSLVARRVLMPADFDGALQVLPAGAEASLRATFAAALPVSGYSLDVFYP